MTSICGAQWRSPIVRVTRDTEAGGSLEQEVEAAVSCDGAAALQPEQHSETAVQKKFRKKCPLPLATRLKMTALPAWPA